MNTFQKDLININIEVEISREKDNKNVKTVLEQFMVLQYYGEESGNCKKSF